MSIEEEMSSTSTSAEVAETVSEVAANQNKRALDAEQVLAAQQWVKKLEAEIARVVVGQQVVMRQVVVALLAGGHVLVEGLPGLGKTLLMRSLAAVVGGRFARVQFTPDLMPSDITGHVMYDQQQQRFQLRKGPVFCHFLLGDEINRAPAKTQAALLEAMQERQVTIEGRSQELPKPFMVLATQNPLEQEGTYALPQAQLDRFLLNIVMGYPSEADEVRLVQQVTSGQVGDQLDVSTLSVLFDPEKIQTLQELTALVHVDEAVLDYIVRIVRTTRQWQGLEAGAGPRAAIALTRCARAHALASGHPFVTPDDVKTVCLPVLRHRVRLSPDLEIGGQHVDEVLQQLVNSVVAPRE